MYLLRFEGCRVVTGVETFEDVDLVALVEFL